MPVAPHINLHKKVIAWGCVILQLLPPVTGILTALPAYASRPQTISFAPQDPSGSNPFEQHIANGVVMLGTVFSNENSSPSQRLSDYARGQAGNALNSTAQTMISTTINQIRPN